MTGNTNEAFLIKRSKAKLTLTYKSTIIKKCMIFKTRKHIKHPYFSKYSLFPYYKTTLQTISALWPKKAELYFQNCDVRKLFKLKVSPNTKSYNAEIARDPSMIRFRIMTKKKFSAFWHKKIELDFQNCYVLKLFMLEVSLYTISHNAEIARDPYLIHFRIMTKKNTLFSGNFFR